MNMQNTEIWVLCEVEGGGVRPVGLELLGKARDMATSVGGRVSAVTLCRTGAKLAAYGADRIIALDLPEMPDEVRAADELARLAQKYRPDILLVGATDYGRAVAPRVAALADTGLTADCTALEIDSETALLRQTRPAFGGNLMATIVCPDARPQMATVRPKVFPVPAPIAERTCDTLYEAPMCAPSGIKRLALRPADEDSIADAETIVAIGQGIGSEENIALAKRLAGRLGAAMAASRPMIERGVLPYAHQVGQTGRTVSPKLYIALGISGAIQHMAGIAGGTIVAVNTDPDAPIFRSARYGIREDCGAFLREMLDALDAKKA